MVGQVAARVSWRPSLSSATARAARSSLGLGAGTGISGVVGKIHTSTTEKNG